MKTLLIPAERKLNLSPDFSVFGKLPKNLSIVYSIQYREVAEKIFKELRKTHKIGSFSQVLGCSKINFKEKSILLIGSGKFHAFVFQFQHNALRVFFAHA